MSTGIPRPLSRTSAEPIVVQDDLDPGAVPAQGLVHGVVDDLPEAVQQPAAVGGADVHAGALADRLEALQDRQMARGVAVGDGWLRRAAAALTAVTAGLLTGTGAGARIGLKAD